MRNWTTPAQRRRFHELHEDGLTYDEIAAQHGVSSGCVRYWCRRLRRGGGAESRYRRATLGPLSTFPPLLRYVLLRLRLLHPAWGANRLRAKLAQRPSLRGLRVPSRAAIARYLQQWPRFRRARRKRRSPPRLAQPHAVHQRWQLDFKMGIGLGDGSQANLHTLCDVVGECCLAARLTDAGRQGHPPRRVLGREAQHSLRSAFAFWHTLPQELQTDNDSVLVGPRSRGAFPTPFTLWMIGLGIQHLTIRPGRPTENAEVERWQRTLNDYAIAGPLPANLEQLQQTLEEARYALAFELPSQAAGCAGRPPALAHPQLTQPSRLFAPEWELAEFDLGRVDQYLARQVWQRTVGKTGQVYLADRPYSVGRRYARQEVWVCFDAQLRRFVFFDSRPPYAELGSRAVKQLEVADLTGLWAADAPGVPQQLPLPFEPGVIVKELREV
jgi:transposase InsO family protein